MKYSSVHTYCCKCDKVQKHIFCSCGNTNIPLEKIEDAPHKDYYVLGGDFEKDRGCYISRNTLKSIINNKKGE